MGKNNLKLPEKSSIDKRLSKGWIVHWLFFWGVEDARSLWFGDPTANQQQTWGKMLNFYKQDS
jgi:hypothetical protein